MLLALVVACSDSPTPPPVDQPTHDLVFDGILDSVPELLALDIETGDVRRLLPAGRLVMDPEPSPDGSRIAFVVADYASGVADIWVMNRDGSNLVQLTTDPEIDDSPSWSPDGARIVFRSFRTQRDGDIWVMDVDGSDPVNLTPDPLPGVTDERRPAWSPDGARIAYASNAGGNFDIWVMDADGGNPVRLTNSPDLDAEPAWSPDGAAIAFRRSNATAHDIHIVAVTGGATTPVLLPEDQRMPVWTPDGSRLVFVQQAAPGVRPDLYAALPDGTEHIPLVTDAVAKGSLNPAFLRRP